MTIGKRREIKAADAEDKTRFFKKSSGLLLKWCSGQVTKFFKQKFSDFKELYRRYGLPWQLSGKESACNAGDMRWIFGP